MVLTISGIQPALRKCSIVLPFVIPFSRYFSGDGGSYKLLKGTT